MLFAHPRVAVVRDAYGLSDFVEHIVMVRPRQNNEGSLIYLDKDTGYETPEAYESLRGRLRDIIKGPISG